MKERGFKGVWIPKEIWLNDDLTIMEKLFLVEIDSLDNEDGCYASNAHFSEFFQLSKNRCTEIIKSLEAKGLISVDLTKEGKAVTKRIIRVLGIRKTEYPYSENLDTPIRKTEYPYSENKDGNNTCINNTCEHEDRAHIFLKNKFRSRFEIVEMQNKKYVNNWNDLLEGFSDKVVIEELEWKQEILFARLNSYIRAWRNNQQKAVRLNPEAEVPAYRQKIFKG